MYIIIIIEYKDTELGYLRTAETPKYGHSEIRTSCIIRTQYFISMYIQFIQLYYFTPEIGAPL